MATGYRHGIYTGELPTSILPARTVDSAVIFAVGTAAGNGRSGRAPVNEPRLYYSFDEFVSEMGWDADHFGDYTLQELAYSHFALYRSAPIVCVNVFDPAKHVREEQRQITFPTEGADNDLVRIEPGMSNLRLLSLDGAEYKVDADYGFIGETGEIVRFYNGAIPEGATVMACWDVPDVGKVGWEDIVGGIDPATGKGMGIELIDEVFPKFRLVPSIVLAPSFCEVDTVAVVMAAKCDNINGMFKAICLVDIPTSGPNAVTRYADAPAWKERHNLTDKAMIVCWPKVKLGDNVYGLSTHLAGLMAQTDGDHDGIPYASPSNKVMSIISSGYETADGQWEEVWLDNLKANYLNGQGIYTVSNFDGGMKSWGGRMACYPSNTDPKDAWDSIRRFFNWYQAVFILTYFSKIDEPLTRRLVQTFLKSEQIKLDGYTAREIILGGSITFDESENPLTDLIDGIMRFHIRITPPPPARVVEADFEFDPNSLNALFA